MRYLSVVEEQRVFEFTRVTQHAVGPDDDVAANVSTGPNLGSFPDPRRADDRGVGRQFYRRVNVDVALNVHAGRKRRLRLREILRGEGWRDAFQPFPRGDITWKMSGKRSERGRQTEKIGGFHTWKDLGLNQNGGKGQRLFKRAYLFSS